MANQWQIIFTFSVLLNPATRDQPDNFKKTTQSTLIAEIVNMVHYHTDIRHLTK